MKCFQCGRDSIPLVGLVTPADPTKNKHFCSWECLGAYKHDGSRSLVSQFVEVLDRLNLPDRLVVLDGDHSTKPAFCSVCGRNFPSDQKDYSDLSWHDPTCAVLELTSLIAATRR